MVAMFALTARVKKIGEDDEKNVVVDLKRERAKKESEGCFVQLIIFDR